MFRKYRYHLVIVVGFTLSVIFFQNCAKKFVVQSNESSSYFDQLGKIFKNATQFNIYSMALDSAQLSYGTLDVSTELSMGYNYKFANPNAVAEFNPLKISLGQNLTEILVDKNDSLGLRYSGFYAKGYTKCELFVKSAGNLQASECPGFQINQDSESEYGKIATIPEDDYTFVFTNQNGSKLTYIARIIYQENKLKSTLGHANASTRVVQPQCFYNSENSECIFWKNPVASRGQGFNQPINENDLLVAEQLYPIHFNLNENKFQNESFSVWNANYAEDGKVLSKEIAKIGQRKLVYGVGSEDNKNLANSISFFWANKLKDLFIQTTGRSWLETKGLNIFSMDSNVSNNAYFDSSVVKGQSRLVLGVVSTQRSGQGNAKSPMALSSDVIIHELGHANHFFSVVHSANDNYELADAIWGNRPNQTSDKIPVLYKITGFEIKDGNYLPKFSKTPSEGQVISSEKDISKLPTPMIKVLNSEEGSEIGLDFRNSSFNLPGIFFNPTEAQASEQSQISRIQARSCLNKSNQQKGACFNSFIEEFGQSGNWYAYIFFSSEISNCGPRGCSSALAESIGDITTMLMFPSSPAILQTFCNKLSTKNCGGADLRDPTLPIRSMLTYSHPVLGREPHLMGGFFNALNFQILRKFENAFPDSGYHDYVLLFNESIAKFVGHATFDDTENIYKAILSTLDIPEAKKAIYLYIIETECRRALSL